MNGLDRLNLEKLINDPHECQYRIAMREFFEYQIPLKCPYRAMVKAFFEKLKENEMDKEAGF